MIRGAPAPMAEPPPVIFCHDSPKRVLVSVIRTTPATPPCSGVGEPEQPPPLVPTSPGFSDFMVYPWRWGENAHNVTLSPGAAGGAVSAGLPAAAELSTLRGAPPSTASVAAASGGEDEEEASSPDSGHLKDGIRRGRPRADTVRDLINEGEHSSSRIRCNICNRVFPREKSLQAHKRTHTDTSVPWFATGTQKSKC